MMNGSSFNVSNLNDQEFLLLFIDEYLNGTLDPALKQKYVTLLNQEHNQKLIEQYSYIRGKMQTYFQENKLDIATIEEIKSNIENPEIRQTREVQKIEEIGHYEALFDFFKKFIMIIIILSIIFMVVYYFSPSPKSSLDVLSTIAQEALLISEDPEGRLNFPTDNLVEITNYIVADKSLNFMPKTFKKIPEGWKISGASVINYDIEKVKIIVIQLTNLANKEYLYQFIFKGSMSDLPKAEKGNYRGLIYQAYANDNVNIIVWQIADDTLSALVGKSSGTELAHIAKTYF